MTIAVSYHIQRACDGETGWSLRCTTGYDVGSLVAFRCPFNPPSVICVTPKRVPPVVCETCKDNAAPSAFIVEVTFGETVIGPYKLVKLTPCIYQVLINDGVPPLPEFDLLYTFTLGEGAQSFSRYNPHSGVELKFASTINTMEEPGCDRTFTMEYDPIGSGIPGSGTAVITPSFGDEEGE